MIRYIFIFFILSLNLPANSQLRIKRSMNSGWQFHKGDVTSAPWHSHSINWQRINLPHTWNNQDMLDDEPGYYRGICWYQKEFLLPAKLQNKEVYVFFEGANQDAIVYINGQKVGEHKGGYTAFCFNVTNLLDYNQPNTLSVRLSNAHNKDVPPVGGDLGHFGGIYRDVYLIGVNPDHFDLSFYASNGVFIKQSYETGRNPELKIVSRINHPTDKKLELHHTLITPNGERSEHVSQKLKSKEGRLINNETIIKDIKSPLFWSPDSPALYTLRSELIDSETEQVLDRIDNPLGFRHITSNPDKGIFLNGKAVYIKGIGKHQDYHKLGYAVEDDINREDVNLIDEAGGNLMRSHYPLDPSTYDLCDKKGIMVWAKIPVMDKINHTADFYENTATMMKELIYQNYNRPSVIMWGFACELFGDMDWYWPSPKKPEKIKENLIETKKFSKEMEQLIRDLDPSRLTANDFHTDPTPEYYKRSGLTEINMVNGWNLYQGWYHNNLDSIGWALETFRSYNPDVPFLIAEYGAGSDPRIHSYNPTIFDFSIEYQNIFHEAYLKTVKKYPFVHGQCVWTLFDFQVDSRSDAVPHINSKGLLNSDRTPKDSYFLYKAWWSDKPFIYIAGKSWNKRVEIAHKEDKIERQVKIYTNLPEAELFLNGKSLGIKEAKDHIITWSVPFSEGINTVSAHSISGEKVYEDFMEIHYSLLHEGLKKLSIPGNELCLNTGQSRTWFLDATNNDIWIPDQKYQNGYWGHISGNYHRKWPNMQAWDGIREGISQNILNTENDPVYQTFLEGDIHYQVNLPEGDYELILYFAEPFSNEQSRIFDVIINGQLVLDDLNLKEEYGALMAVQKKIPVSVDDNTLTIKCMSSEGRGLINGIKLIRK